MTKYGVVFIFLTMEEDCMIQSECSDSDMC